jgi:hypothetical protein
LAENNITRVRLSNEQELIGAIRISDPFQCNAEKLEAVSLFGMIEMMWPHLRR